MTYTIDQVKRLVPEATKVEPTGDDGFYVILEGIFYHDFEHPLKYLLTTRAQLAIARAALENVDKGFYCHKLTIREAQRKIREALDTIAKTDQ